MRALGPDAVIDGTSLETRFKLITPPPSCPHLMTLACCCVNLFVRREKLSPNSAVNHGLGNAGGVVTWVILNTRRF